MDFKELEKLGYNSKEIEELQELGVAELVVSAHSQMEIAREEEEVVAGTPLWATAAFALVSAVLLAAPWAAEIVGSVDSIVQNSRKEAHRELLQKAFGEEKIEIKWDVVVFDPDETYIALDGKGCLIPWYEVNSSAKCIENTEWKDFSNRQYN